ncbi:armadillo repeat-containing protein 8 [Planoprotostelium fungivorum]|uniref:Armadillo repeat-containing protein 8 n=1 Tax=Planoprotostelium fungivorum TaxID=1890364 RepID=A0A2P6NVK2_9EUKA|nr:armadillo repeat-containing protein 8 [Planoprotostelium fungivorum]
MADIKEVMSNMDAELMVLDQKSLHRIVRCIKNRIIGSIANKLKYLQEGAIDRLLRCLSLLKEQETVDFNLLIEIIVTIGSFYQVHSSNDGPYTQQYKNYCSQSDLANWTVPKVLVPLIRMLNEEGQRNQSQHPRFYNSISATLHIILKSSILDGCTTLQQLQKVIVNCITNSLDKNDGRDMPTLSSIITLYSILLHSRCYQDDYMHRITQFHSYIFYSGIIPCVTLYIKRLSNSHDLRSMMHLLISCTLPALSFNEEYSRTDPPPTPPPINPITSIISSDIDLMRLIIHRMEIGDEYMRCCCRLLLFILKNEGDVMHWDLSNHIVKWVTSSKSHKSRDDIIDLATLFLAHKINTSKSVNVPNLLYPWLSSQLILLEKGDINARDVIHLMVFSAAIHQDTEERKRMVTADAVSILCKKLNTQHPGLTYVLVRCIRSLSRSPRLISFVMGETISNVVHPIAKHMWNNNSAIVHFALCCLSNLSIECSVAKQMYIQLGIVDRVKHIYTHHENTMGVDCARFLRNLTSRSPMGIKREVVSRFGAKNLLSLLQKEDEGILQQVLGLMGNLWAVHFSEPLDEENVSHYCSWLATHIPPHDLVEILWQDISIHKDHHDVILRCIVNIAGSGFKSDILKHGKLVEFICEGLNDSKTRESSLWCLTNLIPFPQPTLARSIDSDKNNCLREEQKDKIVRALSKIVMGSEHKQIVNRARVCLAAVELS